MSTEVKSYIFHIMNNTFLIAFPFRKFYAHHLNPLYAVPALLYPQVTVQKRAQVEGSCGLTHRC